MKTNNLMRASVAALAIATASTGFAQTPAVPANPVPTIWRFMGIPQGLQKIRDVTVNRRGNFPGLERKPPLKRIGDPANLESENPAIKAAAEIKQAEDLKAQKIKAIKFLAKMGCGCYDKEGKITDALIAAMDDCTPDVRLAAIAAIETAAGEECCSKCGSTSCCSEKVTKRLSEIAYERDDTGCHLEPSAEVREAAAKALCTCCPNRATGPIEEDIPEAPEPIPTPVDDPDIKGEGGGDEEGIQGEGGGAPDLDVDAGEGEADVEAGEDEGEEGAAEATTSVDNLILFQSAKKERTGVQVGEIKMIGGMAIQPVTISPVGATEDVSKPEPKLPKPITLSLSDEPTDSKPVKASQNKTVPLPTPVALPIKEAGSATQQSFAPKPVQRKKVLATIVGVDQRTGRVMLRSGQGMRVGSSVTVYHQYLTGERLIAHLLIKSVNGNQAVAMVTDASGLTKIQSGDRAVCF